MSIKNNCLSLMSKKFLVPNKNEDIFMFVLRIDKKVVTR